MKDDVPNIRALAEAVAQHLPGYAVAPVDGEDDARWGNENAYLIAGGGRFILLAGGIPVKFEKAVIGAVGCSSGTVDQDAAVAQAGVAAIEERLQKVGAG